MTEIVTLYDPDSEQRTYELARPDGSRLTDLELGWPHSVGVTASFFQRDLAESALEQLGCYDCGDQNCTYVSWANLALCTACLRERADEMEGDRAYDAARDGC